MLDYGSTEPTSLGLVCFSFCKPSDVCLAEKIDTFGGFVSYYHLPSHKVWSYLLLTCFFLFFFLLLCFPSLSFHHKPISQYAFLLLVQLECKLRNWLDWVSSVTYSAITPVIDDLCRRTSSAVLPKSVVLMEGLSSTSPMLQVPKSRPYAGG